MIIGAYNNLEKSGFGVGDDVYGCHISMDGVSILSVKPHRGRLHMIEKDLCLIPFYNLNVLDWRKARKVKELEFVTSLEACQVLYNRKLAQIEERLQDLQKDLKSLHISCPNYTESELEKWWAGFKVSDVDVVVRLINAHNEAKPTMLRAISMPNTWNQMSVMDKSILYEILDEERTEIVRQRAAVVPVIEET